MQPETITLHDTDDTLHFVIPTAPESEGEITAAEMRRDASSCGPCKCDDACVIPLCAEPSQ